MKKSPRYKTERREKSVIESYFDMSMGMSVFGDADPTLFEGEIYRFKPGMEMNFIPRWV